MSTSSRRRQLQTSTTKTSSTNVTVRDGKIEVIWESPPSREQEGDRCLDNRVDFDQRRWHGTPLGDIA